MNIFLSFSNVFCIPRNTFSNDNAVGKSPKVIHHIQHYNYSRFIQGTRHIPLFVSSYCFVSAKTNHAYQVIIIDKITNKNVLRD